MNLNYATKINPVGNGKYIGQLLEGDQVVYTTNELSDPILVSRSLSQQLANLKTPTAILPKISTPSIPPPVVKPTSVSPAPEKFHTNVPTYRQPSSPKKCCGRG